ncbi:uncharacterized protein KGF55_000821 [Candida pseudojiufengensis]|uniref:uncharacterized protein n=1 Tax=Candida pseudojiufengensis TaxID=497109 RepID=UPI0022247B63|nr:uncharacterized protein KGF55_000821 [Candida pseudojiufengensis]KAI5966512.1 hypothetical protein KGF55_000821 [Candida pseudojiufengensis]
MKQNEVKKVKEIPLISGNNIQGTYNILKTKLYFLVLNVFSTYDQNRVKFEVTDFTAHPQLFDEYCAERTYDEIVVDTRKILKICVFKDKLDFISKCYEETHEGLKLDIRHELSLNGGSSANLDTKLIIMSMTIKWREYKGKLEPYSFDPEIVEWIPSSMDKQEEQVLTDLYKNILKQRHYIDALEKRGINRVKKIIPERIYQQFYINNDHQFGSQDVSRNATQSQQESSNQTQNRHQSQSHDIIEDRPQVVTDSVKEEESVSNNLSPDPMNEDYDLDTLGCDEDLPLPAINAESQNRHNSQKPVQSTSSKKRSRTDDDVFASIQSLNAYNEYEMKVDNNTYKVKCNIIGTMPHDLSLVCGKKLIKDPINKKMILGDPIINDLILFIVEPGLEYGTELDELDFIQLHVFEENILKFFGYDRIEELYINTPNLKIDFDKVYELEITKEEIYDGIVVWKYKNGYEDSL